MQKWSQIVLRVGIGLVIIYFGLQQVSDPTGWITYLPLWIKDIPISEINFIYFNGWFELIFGTLLVLGFYTRIVSFFLSLHLLSIVYTVGYNEIGVRDFGIFVAILAIFLHGPSK
ncbi:hypothetical protein A3A05_03260 [Candidatus Nomurabacteria bacterium RIFCSPLOWO2_01_FULL_41_12]|uniref:DoxX family protein n=1 Tax=Candidatus Nomurabacteria bacterium RIFCSPLOWO2_01_FULL_41_12 TaxID=1801774 RepID=A0A1F6WV56_9BACT|nr:MAG: hypothetical protein A2732_01590 [Candidatus Nomurabacteria bacterium RIFCSPHIGHO2_01_FULL_40_10]OGI85740.1 MAG: hypothetical protein A3A05_03260 [Candidatus Nomurabacteria bacterium RIFCSPLOWO2_01_FULL_41_12]